jgi:hypothetical protein
MTGTPQGREEVDFKPLRGHEISRVEYAGRANQ